MGLEAGRGTELCPVHILKMFIYSSFYLKLIVHSISLQGENIISLLDLQLK